MTSYGKFVDFVRDGDWQNALEEINSGNVCSATVAADSSVFTWLIDINAPSSLILELMSSCSRLESVELDRFDVLRKCMEESYAKSNAFNTFSKALKWGLDPNVYWDGSTLLQKAIEMNRVREISELLLHGADPFKLSLFGRESTSSIDDALESGNDASSVLLNHVNVAK